MPRRRNLSEKAPRKSRSSKLSREEIARREAKYASLYSDKDYQLIAEALGVFPSHVERLSKVFEDAARWYRLEVGSPPRRPRTKPSDVRKKLLQISKAATRLLGHLGVADADDAAEGRGDREIFDALVLAYEDASEDDFLRSIQAIALLPQIVASACAAIDIRGRAIQARRDSVDVGELGGLKTYDGNRPLNQWVSAMLGIYKALTRVDPFSPLKYGRGSQLCLFLDAASRPLKIEQAPSQWRERVKALARRHV